MKKRWLPLVIVFAFLLLGWALFQWLNPGEGLKAGEPGFRTWFWEQRALDLAVQVALVFAGALGIAAILPLEDQDE